MAAPGVTNPVSKDGIIWWNMHASEDDWKDACPEFLTHIDDADRATLAMHDRDYERASWDAVCELISTNHLERFKRVPSDLRRYREYMDMIKKQYGSILSFILSERLGWQDLTARGGPFEYADDYKILRNDWPYGIDERILHLVVWTKFGFEEDPVTGDLTPRAKQQIEDFVCAAFEPGVNRKNVAWFKNWAALKSVHAVEHFHVLLFDPDPAFVSKITNGDVAISTKQVRQSSSIS